MFKTLDFFHFGPSFKHWIKTLYNLPVGKVKNNGHISDEFKISNGIRQGCPVSALIFILSIEMFGLKIRQEVDLKGYNFGYPEKPVKIVQYADDCILLLNDLDEFCTALSILDDFGDITGLQLNVSKSEGLWLGQDKTRQKHCSLFGVKWPEQIRCLGLYVGHSKEKNSDMNWISKINKVECILESWRKRDLSLLGKVQLIKTFALSQFVLPATLLVIPPNVIKRIESMLYKFLWGGKDKVKRKRVIQELKHGDLNMVDIRSAFMSFKAAWVLSILKSNPSIHSWAQLANYYLKPFLQSHKELIFNFDDSVNFPELLLLNSFYRDVLTCYNKAFVKDKDTFVNEIKDEYLWGNKFIVKRGSGKNMAFFFRNWIRSGVNKVSDLYFVDGKLDMVHMYDIIISKINILSELLTMREALLPYQEYFLNMDCVHWVQGVSPFKPKKSKDFYVIFKQLLTTDSAVITGYLKSHCDKDDFTFVFMRKIVQEKEIKLKEFNYKLLHGILPCNKNLMKWKIRMNDECDVCQREQSIKHLLFECVYVKPLWEVVEKICDFEITFDKILGIEECHSQDRILTLV